MHYSHAMKLGFLTLLSIVISTGISLQAVAACYEGLQIQKQRQFRGFSFRMLPDSKICEKHSGIYVFSNSEGKKPVSIYHRELEYSISYQNQSDATGPANSFCQSMGFQRTFPADNELFDVIQSFDTMATVDLWLLNILQIGSDSVYRHAENVQVPKLETKDDVNLVVPRLTLGISNRFYKTIACQGLLQKKSQKASVFLKARLDQNKFARLGTVAGDLQGDRELIEILKPIKHGIMVSSRITPALSADGSVIIEECLFRNKIQFMNLSASDRSQCTPGAIRAKYLDKVALYAVPVRLAFVPKGTEDEFQVMLSVDKMRLNAAGRAACTLAGLKFNESKVGSIDLLTPRLRRIKIPMSDVKTFVIENFPGHRQSQNSDQLLVRTFSILKNGDLGIQSEKTLNYRDYNQSVEIPWNNTRSPVPFGKQLLVGLKSVECDL